MEDMDEDELQGGEDIMYSDFFGGQGQSQPCPRAGTSNFVFIIQYHFSLRAAGRSAAGRLTASLEAASAPLSK